MQRCRIGRNSDNDLIIQDRAANDFHAVITAEEDSRIFIEDLSTHYGTLVNGKRIQRCELFPGDEVQIGFSRIDWESRTSVTPTLTEIGIRPNLSVPVKRPFTQSIDAYQQAVERVESSYRGQASKELAGVMMENEQISNRLETESKPAPMKATSEEPAANQPLSEEEIPTQPIADQPALAIHPEFQEQTDTSQKAVDATAEEHVSQPVASTPATSSKEFSSQVITVVPENAPAQSPSRNGEFVQIIGVIAIVGLLMLIGWILGAS